ncbi:pentatricopeptide repeat-containing protein At3g22470, mitochondrial-like [Papaver somniferum]|uniref:pentatricopeptide repeat-containing protein At3g22470, mitochondrial-like n=1 Tax=Papaver somniferum TaxID=3469 RepID=UPI000E6F595F|nr:pentatricopeptide repeat-containing protein At3g22470, mitochondrial-like [Papaver somniferum]
MESFVREECKSGKIKKLEDGLKYFDKLILERPLPSNIDHGFSLLGEIIKRGYRPDAVTLTTLIKGLCLQENIHSAFEVFAKMTEMGIQPNAFTCNTLIHGLCKTGQVGLALQLKNKMPKWNCRPNVVSYSVIIDTLCKGHLKEAKRLFDEMVGKGIPANLIAYNCMIDGYCKNRKLDKAMKLFKKMKKKKGLKPSVVTYNTFLAGLYRVGRMKTVENLIIEMQTFGLSPDIVMYGTMLDGYCKNGKMEEAIKLFEFMEGTGILINIHMYIILIHGFLQAGKLEDATKLFDEILRKGLVPNVVTENAIQGDDSLQSAKKSFMENFSPLVGSCSSNHRNPPGSLCGGTSSWSGMVSKDLRNLQMKSDDLKYRDPQLFNGQKAFVSSLDDFEDDI